MSGLHQGIVIAVNEKTALVKTNRHSQCENCGSCPGNSAIVLDAVNAVDAQVGQNVLVEVKEVNMLRAAFVVYLLPLLTTAAGYAAGSLLAQQIAQDLAPFWQIGGGLLGFLAAFPYIRRFDRQSRSRENSCPQIIKII